VTLTWSSPSSRARLLPKDMAPRPPPPPCIWRMKYTQTAISSRIGKEEMNSCIRNDCRCGGLERKLTPAFFSSPISARLSVSGLKVVKRSPLVKVPMILSPSNTTSVTEPSSTRCRKLEYGMSCAVRGAVPKLLKTVNSTTAMTIHNTMFLARSFKMTSSSALARAIARPLRHYMTR
jgi:hypothetical protein